MAGDNRREGRGRLSSLDLLPEDAEPDLVWALETLRERSMPQNAILNELNARLADRGIAKLSKSSFSRWAIRKAIQFRRLDEVRAITGDIIGNLGPDGADNVTMAVSEMLKAAVYERLEGDNNPKALLELSRALSSAVAAQRASAEHRRQLQVELEARLKKTADAVAEAGAKGAVAEDTLKKITSLLTTGSY